MYVTSVELREERLGARGGTLLHKLHTKGYGFQDSQKKKLKFQLDIQRKSSQMLLAPGQVLHHVV